MEGLLKTYPFAMAFRFRGPPARSAFDSIRQLASPNFPETGGILADPVPKCVGIRSPNAFLTDPMLEIALASPCNKGSVHRRAIRGWRTRRVP